MHDDSLAFMPATDLAAAIRIRRLSPVEVTRAALDRINRAQPVLNAFLLSPEMPPWRGDAVGPLLGAPVAVKDLVPRASAPPGVR